MDLQTEFMINEYLPNNAILSDISNFFSLFSDVTRVKLISALSMSELCVNDLACVLKLNQTTVSHQLKLLRDSRLVEFRREGKIIYYRLSNVDVNEIIMSAIKTIDNANLSKSIS